MAERSKDGRMRPVDHGREPTRSEAAEISALRLIFWGIVLVVAAIAILIVAGDHSWWVMVAGALAVVGAIMAGRGINRDGM